MIQLEAEIDTLKNLDAYEKGGELDRLRGELGRVEALLEGEGQRRDQRERDLADAQAHLAHASEAVRTRPETSCGPRTSSITWPATLAPHA